MSWYGDWKPYVPVAMRRAKAARYAAQLAKKEKRALCPVQIAGRKIADSFWGRAWCDHLERYSDFANRLPRGRTYVRNGSVIDLQIAHGKVQALVSGSDIYTVTIAIKTVPKPVWSRIKQECAQSIDSLIDLLRGRFDEGIMQRLSHREDGLFPQPKEIEMDCSCPDWADMCKHVAATLYGVGARLDTAPELLFTLRDVDHLELIGQAVAAENLDRTLGAGQTNALAGSDLGEMFGIEIEGNVHVAQPTKAPRSLGSVKSQPKAVATSRGKTARNGRPKSTTKSRKVAKKTPARHSAANSTKTPKRMAAAVARKRRAR